MGKLVGAIRYLLGMLTSSTGLKNMYIYRGSVLSLLTFAGGLATSRSIDTAVNVVFEFYITRLIPWPLDEALFAQTLSELILSHAITIGVGLLVATSKWAKNA
jgi:hypothetical protein